MTQPSQQDPNLSGLTTKTGKRTERLLLNIWEPLDLLGQGLMGSLWKSVYLSIQDATALGVLLKRPSRVSSVNYRIESG